MGSKTGIQWTGTHGRTWNPWQGCHKVSAGCRSCYMFREKTRYGQDPNTVVRSAPGTFNAPNSRSLKWRERGLVFTCSWSDWFIEEADPWRDEAWAVIRSRPDLTFQILTKRVDRILDHLPADWEGGYRNVWIGASMGTLEEAQKLSQLAEVPAVVRFISAEPLLELVPFRDIPGRDRIHWAIFGGESGDIGGKYAARGMGPTAAEAKDNLLHSIAEFDGTPTRVFVKQLGSVWARLVGAKDGHGGDPEEWPQDARLRREWPVGWGPRGREDVSR